MKLAKLNLTSDQNFLFQKVEKIHKYYLYKTNIMKKESHKNMPSSIQKFHLKIQMI